MKVITLGGKVIGMKHPPYIVAELSANHNGSLNRALQLIEVAAKSGVNAVKLQTYKPDTMTIDCSAAEFQLSDGLWAGKSLYELYEWAYTPWEWHEPLFSKARELGLAAFSTPFDISAIDFLEKLNVPAYKIASFELVDLELIRHAAQTGKPLILSTGIANQEEIGEAIEVANDAGCRELMLMHCISSYPALPSDCHLKTIPDMAMRFGVPVGLSDHTLGTAVAVASVALGACMIEKHFTLNQSGNGPDDSFSIEPDDLKLLCQSIKSAWDALGEVNYSLKNGEKAMVKYRRSLYVVRDIKAGGIFTRENIRSIRPGYGLHPRYLNKVVGKISTCDISRGTPLDKNMIRSL